MFIYTVLVDIASTIFPAGICVICMIYQHATRSGQIVVCVIYWLLSRTAYPQRPPRQDLVVDDLLAVPGTYAQ